MSSPTLSGLFQQAQSYAVAVGTTGNSAAVPVILTSAPTTSTIGPPYPLGKRAIIPSTNSEYTLTSFSSAGGSVTANWIPIGGSSLILSTLTGDSGGPIPPTAGNITLAGTSAQVKTTGTGSTITISLIGPYTPATYTAHGVLLGEGATSIVATAVGSDGQVLTGNTGADPSFGAIGIRSGLTAHGVVIAEGASAFAATGVGTTGQVFTGATGADPAWQNYGVNSGLTGLVLGNTNAAFTTATYTAAGAFTPAFALSTPGDSAWTYTTRVGRYTQIGSVVYFVAQLVWSNFANTTGSGTWQLNLPVASGAFALTGQVAISGSGIDAGAETANLPANFLGVIGSGVSTMILSVEEGGIGNAASALFNLTVTQVLTAGTLNISGWYFAA